MAGRGTPRVQRGSWRSKILSHGQNATTPSGELSWHGRRHRFRSIVPACNSKRMRGCVRARRDQAADAARLSLHGCVFQSIRAESVFASRGCVVLSVEYRSSIMRGYAFRNAPGWGTAGASEYQDVLGGANYLKSRADLHVANIGIFGLSWGGYLTAQALARNSDVFKVGFDMAGVHSFPHDAFKYSPAAFASIGTHRYTSPPATTIVMWTSINPPAHPSAACQSRKG